MQDNLVLGLYHLGFRIINKFINIINFFIEYCYMKKTNIIEHIKLIQSSNNCNIDNNNRTLISNICKINLCDIISKNYKIIKTIYEKMNKAVYLIENKKEKKLNIIKLKNIKVLDGEEEIIYSKLKEINNNNLLEIESYTKTDLLFYVIYPFYDGLLLSDYFKLNKIDSVIITLIIKQITNGLKYLHDNNLIHCDLKLDNIMILDNLNLKIIDYDLVKYCPNKDGVIMNQIIGTVKYLAPESIDLKLYSKKTDIWSLGIIIYYLIFNKYPINSQEILYEDSYTFSKRNKYKHIDFNNENIYIDYYLNIIIELLKNMLKFNERKRYNIDKIIKILDRIE